MQILLIHSDYIEYEIKRSTPVAEKIADDLKKGRMEEALTVFVAVEKNDEENIEYVARQTADEIKKVSDQVKTGRIMLYPYAHLSSSLSSPKAAIEAL
ncbi:MAG TPA: threonyl-tRNA synthetase editing domain-containing protein, partial [Candidatus Methanoperedens sp.]